MHSNTLKREQLPPPPSTRAAPGGEQREHQAANQAGFSSGISAHAEGRGLGACAAELSSLCPLSFMDIYLCFILPVQLLRLLSH